MRFNPTFLILLVLATPSLAHARGGESSGGGDLAPLNEGSAWFLGQGPVRYCVEVSGDFGLKAPEIQEAISGAVTTWKNYLALIQKWDAHAVKDLDLNYQAISRCDGSEDVRFFFGINNEEVKKARTVFFKPSFFAHRNSYDEKLGRGKGFIWVDARLPSLQNSSVWTEPLLETALLHEIGHVLGCAHIEGTIMREGIAQDFWNKETVDGARMLVLHTSTEEISRVFDPEDRWSISKQTFKNMIAHDATSDSVQSKIKIMPTATGAFGAILSLTSGNQSGQIVFEPMVDAQGAGTGSGYETSGPAIFKQVRQDGLSAYTYSPEGFITFGTVKDSLGNTYFATLELNMTSPRTTWSINLSQHPFGLFYYPKNHRQGLFF